MAEFYGKADNVRSVTGVGPVDFNLEDNPDPESDLTELLETWLRQISAEVNARLPQGRIDEEDPKYEAVSGLVERKVADLVGYARYQRTSPVVQIDDFAISQISSSEVLKNLDEELEPFKKPDEGTQGTDDTGSVDVFASTGFD